MEISRDKLLFTPGPLSTTSAIKRAMLRDLGSRDVEFVELLADVRKRLLGLAGAAPGGDHEVVLVQGCGTYGVESVLSSALSAGDRLLVVSNGVYGDRMAQMAQVHGTGLRHERLPTDQAVSGAMVGQWLADDEEITHVAVVHCETTTGLLNPVEEIAEVVGLSGRRLIVDAMSSFGAVPIDLHRWAADFVVTSANKCLESVPGLAIVFARREALEAGEGCARTLSLDLCAQWRGLEGNGQFRFTPPTHAVLALAQALDELEAEGGVAGRSERYAANQRVLHDGMRQLGFRAYLAAEVQGPTITAYHYPETDGFSFQSFYDGLSRRGYLIYPGALDDVACFRVGNIGHLTGVEMAGLLDAMREVLDELRSGA